MEKDNSSMFLCPNCGAFVSEDAEVCPHCGEQLEEPDEKEMELDLDEIIESSREEPEEKAGKKVADEEDTDMEEEAVALFLCSECGAFTSEKEEVCSNCGAALATETDRETPKPVPEAKPPVPDSKRAKPVADKPEVKKKPKEPKVTAKRKPEESKPESEYKETAEEETKPLEDSPLPTLEDEVMDMLVSGEGADELTEEDDQILDLIKGIKRPEDVETLMDSISDDELEDLELDVPVGTMTESSADDKDDIISEIVPTDEEIKVEQKKLDAMESVERKIPKKADIKPMDGQELGLCGLCGAFVSPGQEECGVCGGKLGKDDIIIPSAQPKLIQDKDVTPRRAQETLRNLLGILESTELKKADDRWKGGELRLCTICGAFLADDADGCNICGTHIEDMPDFVPPEMDESVDEVALAVCPFCGVFLNEGTKTCTVCGKGIPEGATLEKVSPDEIVRQADDVERAGEILQKALGVLELKDTDPAEFERGTGTIDLCPECGAFVSINSSICPVCGVTLIEGLDEVEEDILDLETTIEDLASIECPNCGSTIDVGSQNCPLCGLGFETSEIVSEVVEGIIESEEPGEDITEFLEKELPLTIKELEERANVAEREPDIETMEIIEMLEPLQLKDGEEDDLETIELIDMLEPLERGTPGDETGTIEGPTEATETPSEEAELPIEELSLEPEIQKEEPEETEIPVEEPEAPVDGVGEPVAVDEAFLAVEPPIEAPSDVPEPAEALLPEVDIRDLELPESLTWEEDQISDLSKEEIETVVVDVWSADRRVEVEKISPAVTEVSAEPYAEEVVPPEPLREKVPVSIEDIPSYEEEPSYVLPEPIQVRRMSVNWEYCIYGSVAAVVLFIFLYALSPIDYTVALGVIFGVLILVGIYLSITEKSVFVRHDVIRATTFLIGSLIVAFIVLHWAADVLTQSSGSLAQPNLDRILLSLGILMIGVGIVWLRSITRYVFTWFSGTFLLFLSSVTYNGVVAGGASTLSSTVIVGGVGAILVFISLAFLVYEKAIRRSIDSEIMRGDAEHIRSDYESALVAYGHALDRSKSKPSAPPMGYDVPWYSKGSALILMGELEEGLECLDMALAINPNNEVTWVNKGNAHSRLGQHGLAMECFDRAIRLNPNYEIAWNNRGNILARQKRFIEALKCYNRAIKLNPGYDDVWINKGYVLVKMGKQDEAMRCLNHIKARPAPGTGPVRPAQTA
jgi:tetratricopeptide (TPR) repeat protein/RNA polymerase subunit RPABC4/transcription elongation factor Spt4